MLKKILYTIALASYVACSVQAQEVSEYKPLFGIRGGLTFAPTDFEGSTIVAPTFGMSVKFKISKQPLFFETGAYYTNRYIYDDSNNSLLFPALLNYHVKLKSEWCIQPFFGPFIAYGFNQSEFDGGLRCGVGFSKSKFYINCGYDISFNYSIDEDAIFVTAGYNF